MTTSKTTSLSLAKKKNKKAASKSEITTSDNKPRINKTLQGIGFEPATSIFGDHALPSRARTLNNRLTIVTNKAATHAIKLPNRCSKSGIKYEHLVPLLLHWFGNLIACIAALFVTIVSRLLSVRAREGRAWDSKSGGSRFEANT